MLYSTRGIAHHDIADIEPAIENIPIPDQPYLNVDDIRYDSWWPCSLGIQRVTACLIEQKFQSRVIGEDSYKRLHRYECLKSTIVNSNSAPPSLRPALEQGLNVASIPKKRKITTALRSRQRIN